MLQWAWRVSYLWESNFSGQYFLQSCELKSLMCSRLDLDKWDTAKIRSHQHEEWGTWASALSVKSFSLCHQSYQSLEERLLPSPFSSPLSVFNSTRSTAIHRTYLNPWPYAHSLLIILLISISNSYTLASALFLPLVLPHMKIVI